MRLFADCCVLQLIDDNGMEAYTKYFTRLVSGNASQIFPGLNRPVLNPGNTYPMLVGEMRKISTEPEQARRIAESIETGNEDVFRDFDLSTFMDHFRLDALEKTILALAFKLGTRPDLKTKGIINKAAVVVPPLEAAVLMTRRSGCNPVGQLPDIRQYPPPPGRRSRRHEPRFYRRDR